MKRWLADRLLVDLRSSEWLPMLGSFAYFFFLLASYYSIRPMRDALAVAGGVSNMQYLFTATFLAMLLIVPLYGWLTSRLPRRQFLPVVYLFFIANLLLLHWAFGRWPDNPWLARGFFVWVSIFNLFVIPVFWSFMSDLYTSGQARRLFGVIAAGGSLGAITGPLLVNALIDRIGVVGLPLLSAALLTVALGFQTGLLAWSRDRVTERKGPDPEVPMGGSILAGATLPFRHAYLAAFCGFMFLGTFSGSLLFFQQAEAVAQNYSDTAEIASVFATLDLAANTLTIVIQVFFTAGLVRWLGIGFSLALLPMVAVAGFAVISTAPVLILIAVVQALRRSVLFAITNPVAGMLFTVVGPQSRYKFKQFADTVVYRAGDSTGGWVFTGLMAAGAGLGGVAILGVGMALVWSGLAFRLGRRFEALQKGQIKLP